MVLRVIVNDGGVFQVMGFAILEGRGVVNAESQDEGVIPYLRPAGPGTAPKRTQLTEEFIRFRRAYGGRDEPSEWRVM
jgi:hypothetical protein